MKTDLLKLLYLFTAAICFSQELVYGIYVPDCSARLAEVSRVVIPVIEQSAQMPEDFFSKTQADEIYRTKNYWSERAPQAKQLLVFNGFILAAIYKRFLEGPSEFQRGVLKTYGDPQLFWALAHNYPSQIMSLGLDYLVEQRTFSSEKKTDIFLSLATIVQRLDPNWKFDFQCGKDSSSILLGSGKVLVISPDAKLYRSDSLTLDAHGYPDYRKMRVRASKCGNESSTVTLKIK